MPQPALVAFDLDGTLIDTAPEIGDAVNDTLTRLGLAASRPTASSAGSATARASC